MAEQTAAPVCPRCGAAMVVRKRRTDRAEFWGCSRFPACRGIRQADVSGDASPADPAEPTGAHYARPGAQPDEAAQPVPSFAGGSARAEFERRAERHRAVMRVARPRLVLFLTVVVGICLLMSRIGPTPPGPIGPSFRLLWLMAIFPIVFAGLAAMLMPQHIKAWDIGASGEEAIGRILAELEPEGFRAIHDRKIPGSSANIDHIFVGPTGIFVIETKSYEGRVRVSWRGELFVAGRRKTGFIDQVKRESAAVERLVAPVPVTPLICFYRGSLGWEWGPTMLHGVRILGAKKLVKAVRNRPAQLSPEEVTALADRIERGLKPA